MKLLIIGLALSLAAPCTFADSRGSYTQVGAERAAILALTNVLQGDVFGAEVKLHSADAKQYVLGVSFSKYHRDDSSGEMALVPCQITIPVLKKTGKAEIQIDDNLMCFQ